MICSPDTYKNAQQNIASIDEKVKEDDAGLKESWQVPKYIKKELVSFGDVDGITNIIARQQFVDENEAPKPAVMRSFDADAGDRCLILWGFQLGPETRDLTTANVFFSAKEQWRKKRNYRVYTSWDSKYHKWNYIPTDFLKEQVFLPFCALEDRKPCEFRGDPDDDDQDVATISKKLKEVPQKINADSSPVLPNKPYTFARCKVNFTMADLENPSSDDEDEDFENNVIPSTSAMRSQPKRSCKTDQNLAIDHSIATDDEEIDEKSMSQEQNEQISDSESNSDWYDYPDSIVSDNEKIAEKSMSQDQNEQISDSEPNSDLYDYPNNDHNPDHVYVEEHKSTPELSTNAQEDFNYYHDFDML